MYFLKTNKGKALKSLQEDKKDIIKLWLTIWLHG